MIEFLRKFENRSIKIARVNSILITKFTNLELLTYILYGFWVCCDLRRFSLLSPFIEKSMIWQMLCTNISETVNSSLISRSEQ